MPRVQWWQWPNVLALDAAWIAVLWQLCFARIMAVDLGLAPCLVLALSVWLTYTADRLFDVHSRPVSALLANRHRFAKQHAKALWRLWIGILLLNLSIALTALTSEQLARGVVLLAACLIYTLLNQKLSAKFFPKELCVAIIFAGGAAVFTGLPWHETIGLSILCLSNCLLIAKREASVDDALKVRSLSRHLKEPMVYFALIAAMLALQNFTQPALRIAFLSTGALLVISGLLRNRLSHENYRVLLDSILLVGPALSLWV
ncbi:MAG: hypothetical protein AAGC73_04010 [Verrucomicrobiota bacterium]